MAGGAQKPTGNPRTFEAPVYGSDEAIAEMRPTYGLGGVPEPSREELATMQKGPYLLHARDGKLSRVPAEKTLLPPDPVVNVQRIHAAMGADGTVYFSHGSTLSKSTDGGRSWSSHELTLEASQNCSFQVLSDGTFVGAASLTSVRDFYGFSDRPKGDVDPAAVWVWASGDEGRTWEKLSEVDNPAIQPAPLVDCPERYADTLCRLPDDTLLLPVESRFGWMLDPAYVHRSTDGGRTWGGPTGPYAEPAFVDTHWVGPNTGPGFMVAESGEQMIARMASGRLLAVIRYHGGLVPQWPLISEDQRTIYKTVFLADSDDLGDTWKDLRPLTNVHGQCHGFGVGLSDGSVVVTHDHRYPPGTPGNKAMISHDEGRTWEDEVYYVSFATVPEGQAGFSESVVLEDDTILTIAGTSDQARDRYLPSSTPGTTTVGRTDVWAIRWKLE
jgi:hypothetical protein